MQDSYRSNIWIECSLEEYDYTDKINYMYEVSEATDEATYYKKTAKEWFNIKGRESDNK